MSIIINLFAGPGGGKSSIAGGLLHKLKKKHCSCDAPYEFPKMLAWDNNGEAIKDQLYVIANQHRGIAKSFNKVDYIIVDSPILLSLVYKNYYAKNNDEYPSCLYGKEFDDLILSMHQYYKTLNIVLVRSKETDHNEKERYHDLQQSIDIDKKIKSILIDNNIQYYEVNVDDDPLNEILNLLFALKNEC